MYKSKHYRYYYDLCTLVKKSKKIYLENLHNMLFYLFKELFIKIFRDKKKLLLWVTLEK